MTTIKYRLHIQRQLGGHADGAHQRIYAGHLQELDLYVNPNLKKEETARRIAQEILDNPLAVLCSLSKSELQLVDEFVKAGPNQYITKKMRKTQYKYAGAVTVLIEVLESFTYHFVEDEHYNYFDDMYSPDYVCQDMMETIISSIKSGNFPAAELQRLKDGLEKLKHMEAYEDYGVPYALNVWKRFLA